MAFSISAELLLGTYRGGGPDGRVERIPSVARLHSALLCAAGFGPRAQERDGRLSPCEDDEAALRWLEENPPDGVSIPALQVNRGRAIAHRDDGTVKKSRGVLSIKKLAKSPDTSVAVDGRFTWTWSSPPPVDVAAALEALCPDVPHLGRSEAPARLTINRDDVASTHTLNPDAGLFTAGGEDIELPLTGRLTELITAHEAVTRTPPPARQDRYRTDERSSAPIPPRVAVALARYVPLQEPVGAVPWPEVVVLPLDRPIAERLKVRWAVAAHRALIATIGDGAPPLVTGSYPPGTARPANRVALHILDAGHPLDLLDGAPAGLAVMLPRHAAPGDLAAVATALTNLRSFRGPGGELRHVVGAPRGAPGDGFWHERPPGTVRLWRTSPPAVPETRGGGAGWTFGHAALLSLGFVWNGSPHLPAVAGRGATRYRSLVQAVADTDAVAVSAEPLRTAAVHDYVHRVNEHAVVRPYRALLSVGRLGGQRTLQAIGQSRHLGGGLLVPTDLPEGSRLDTVDLTAVVHG